MSNPQMERWLHQVCRHIPNPLYRKQVRQELKNHLEDKIRQLRNDGLSEAQAVEKALDCMGDAEKLGKAFTIRGASYMRYMAANVLIWLMIFCLSLYVIGCFLQF